MRINGLVMTYLDALAQYSAYLVTTTNENLACSAASVRYYMCAVYIYKLGTSFRVKKVVLYAETIRIRLTGKYTSYS